MQIRKQIIPGVIVEAYVRVGEGEKSVPKVGNVHEVMLYIICQGLKVSQEESFTRTHAQRKCKTYTFGCLWQVVQTAKVKKRNTRKVLKVAKVTLQGKHSKT